MWLEDWEGRKVTEHEEIPVRLEAYTCERPLNKIEITSEGKLAFIGRTKTKIKGGSVASLRAKFRELTSRHRNGWIFFVVSAESRDDVQPLVIEKVVVNSESSKKKESDQILLKH